MNTRLVIRLAIAAALVATSACSGEALAKKSHELSKEKAMAAVQAGKDLYATFDTTLGTVVCKLFTKDAPKTVDNFVGLATGAKAWKDPRSGEDKTGTGLYDGTMFHRVIPNFMIQGGDPLGTGTGGPGYKFEDEFGSGKVFDKPGILAMANAGPNTNGSQFFITVVPTPHLNNHHTIFGEVVKGQDVVDAIVNTPASGSRPNTPVLIKHLGISEQAPK